MRVIVRWPSRVDPAGEERSSVASLIRNSQLAFEGATMLLRAELAMLPIGCFETVPLWTLIQMPSVALSCTKPAPAKAEGLAEVEVAGRAVAGEIRGRR